LNDISEIPHLAIVPVENLILHEYNDEQRTPHLIKKLYANGVLRNPPIVIPMRQSPDSYLVLDGANRVSAFRRMDIPHILVQIVQLDDPNLELNTWNHILWGLPPDGLFNNLRKVPGIMLQPSTPANSFRDLMDIHTLASIHLPNGSVFTAFTPSANLIDRVAALNRVVERYIKIARLDRTPVFQIRQLCHLYDNLSGLVVLPTFEVTDVMDVVEAGNLMPSGITRFSVSPRVLNVNYNLEKFSSAIMIEEKNEVLQDWLAVRLANKSVRYYAEPTITFDE
jgi:hypothetical protein